MIDVVMEEVVLSALVMVCFCAWRALPVLCVVFAADLAFSRRIAARYHALLWMIVVAAMMCPVSVESPVGMQGRIGPLLASTGLFANKAGVAVDPVPYDSASGLQYDTFTFENGEGEARTIRMLALPENPTAEQRAAAEDFATSEALIKEQPASADTPLPAGHSEAAGMDVVVLAAYVIVGGWFIVAWGFIARGAVQSLRFAVRLRRSRTVTDQAAIDQVLRVCDSMRVGRRPTLKEVEGLEVPAVIGIWRPTICLPVGSADRLSGEELRLILMHEVAHVKRRDGLVLALAIFIRAWHWFNPLAWLAVSRLRVHIEQAADDAALRSASERTVADYGRLLLRFASQDKSLTSPSAVCLLFTSPGKALGRRIAMLRANKQRNHWLAQVAAATFVVVLAACGLTDAQSGSEPEPEPGVWDRLSPPGLSAPRVAFHQADQPVTTNTYDVAAAIATIRETEPHQDAEQRLLSQFDPTTAALEDGRLRITATASMHQQVRDSIAAIEESGCWEATYDVRIGVADVERATFGVIDWTSDAVLPLPSASAKGFDEFPILPLATGFPAPDQLSLEHRGEERSLRTLLGVRITADQVAQFMSNCAQDGAASVLQAPKTTLYGGQTAHIMDESLRPFVTGLRPFVENGAHQVEPIIDVLPEGVRITLRGAVTREERLAMGAMLTVSDIGDVKLAHLPFRMPADGPSKATVQVPQASRVSATANVTLSRGESLLLVAPMSFSAQQPQHGSKAKYYLIMPTWNRQTPGDSAGRIE